MKPTTSHLYGEKWSQISKAARTHCTTCCFCLNKKSNQTHHVRYIDARGNYLLDNVRPGVDVFPVCKDCHDLIHTKKYWNSHKDPAKNHNTKQTIAQLTIGWSINTGLT